MTDGRSHAPHLAFAALMDRDLQQRAASTTREHATPRRRGGTVVEHDSLAQLGDRGPTRCALDLRHVRLVDAVSRMREELGELTVVREHEEPARAHIETSDWMDARRRGHEL